MTHNTATEQPERAEDMTDWMSFSRDVAKSVLQLMNIALELREQGDYAGMMRTLGSAAETSPVVSMGLAHAIRQEQERTS